jgi:hypothetical protein
MHFSAACYQIETTIERSLPCLTAAQQRGLGWWVRGTILAGSACQNAVITALCTTTREWDTVRQYLREWLYDGADKATPCATQVEVRACFVPLLRWVLTLWEGNDLALAVDATAHGTAVTALVVSVLYRGTAIPVAWVILRGTTKGAWMPEILRLLRQLRPAVSSEMTVLVLADRGLWSPRLWKRIKDLGWHALLRLTGSITFAPCGGPRQPARHLVPGPGHAWVGTGVAFTGQRRRAGTLIVVWVTGQQDPWLLLTDLRPRQVGIAWYGLRMWIELGFKALKGLGWQWDKTRRTDPDRVARHWLILAVATLWVLATATRIEDAALLTLPPALLHQPPTRPCWRPPGVTRTVSLICQGITELRRQLLRGRLWQRCWLRPEPWPDPPPHILVHYHDPA